MPDGFKVGDRVRVRDRASLHPGETGVVRYVYNLPIAWPIEVNLGNGVYASYSPDELEVIPCQPK